MQPIGGDRISNTNANLSWTFPQQKEVAAIVFFLSNQGTWEMSKEIDLGYSVSSTLFL